MLFRSDQRNDVIGLVVAKGKEGGFTQEDIDAFNLKDGKIGNVFRMGLENKALQQKATTDNLTHLSNREGMNGFIKSEALPHIQHGEPVSVIILDIDHFKKFNDTYGHEIGDECLKQVACQEALSIGFGGMKEDLACRPNGSCLPPHPHW